MKVTFKKAAMAGALLASAGAEAQGFVDTARGLVDGWQVGAVIDAGITSRPLALGARDSGFGFGHSDLTAMGPLGRHLRAQIGATVATHGDEFERGIEEAWVETTSLPLGLQVRGGRFSSQIGYLNAQHPHADDFVERPLLYRAFFGGHWYDEGLRLNWTAPTDVYWMVGAEAFRGRRLVQDAVSPTSTIGAATLVTKLGGDLGVAHSWQLGLSHLHNRREASVEEEHDHDEEGHDHAGHSHAAQFTGRRTWMVDATWKWAPNGNNRDQQVRVTFEAARIDDLNRYASSSDRHEARALSAVWRFHPSWEVGARSDWLRVRVAHGDHFHSGLLREYTAMVAWKPSHLQSLRLQVATQRDAVEIENRSKRTLQLQYVIAFGAHSAHSY